MVTIRSDFGDLRESARRLRFEQTGDITDTDVQDAIQTLDGKVAARKQRQIASSGDLPIQASDSILNINISAPLAITVPLASSRGGALLTFKNLITSTANATLNRTGSDQFDGQTTFNIPPGSALTLEPFNDSNNSGYGII